MINACMCMLYIPACLWQNVTIAIIFMDECFAHPQTHMLLINVCIHHAALFYIHGHCRATVWRASAITRLSTTAEYIACDDYTAEHTASDGHTAEHTARDDYTAECTVRDVHSFSCTTVWGHPLHNETSHKSYRPLTTLAFRLMWGAQVRLKHPLSHCKPALQ